MRVFKQQFGITYPTVHLGIWVVFILMNLSVFGSYVQLSALTATARALVNVAMMALLFYGNLWLIERFAKGKKLLLYLPTALLLFVSVTLARAIFNGSIEYYDLVHATAFTAAKYPWFWGALFTNAGILLLSYIYWLYTKRLSAERQQLILAEQRREAEVRFLRTQINPHFLFNVLNNLYALARTGSEQTAPNILRLSKFLRYVTYEGVRERVPLDREVEQVREYLDLFQLRSREPLRISFAVNGAIQGHLVEPMLLIPLVENVCKHADFIVNPAAFAELRLEIGADALDFRTLNTFDAEDRQKDELGGVGLENIRRRLALSYAGEAFLHNEVRAGNTFVSHLHLPLS